MKLAIRDRMDNLGITRYKLAKQLGVSYPTMNSMYYGESEVIRLDIFQSLCEILNCTPNDILIFDKEESA